MSFDAHESIRRGRRARVTRLVAGLAMLAALAGPAWTAAQEGRFRDVTEVVVVEVPIQVLQDGEPVRGLTAEDFEIFDGRKRLPIVDFEVIDLSTTEGAAARPVADIPISGRRHFLFLFDLSFSTPGAIVRAREAARDVVNRSLHAADMAAVGTYSRASGARLVLGFTSDRGQLEYALDTLGLVQPVERLRDPLGLVLADPEEFSSRGFATSSTGRPREIGIDVEAEIRELLAGNERRASRTQERNEILAMSAAFSDLAALMNSVHGRKHVVYLSEGFDASILVGTEERQAVRDMNQASELGRVWEIDSDERFGSTATQSILGEMLDAFRQSDCVIQAVDIGGLRAERESEVRISAQDGLFIMANETGGELYRNFNDLGVAMGKLLERTSVTYLAAVQPEPRKLDGRFHPLRVKLKDGSRGVRLVHRPGYYARGFAEQSPLERQLAAAGLVLGGADGGSIAASILAAPFEEGRARAYVPVLIEVDGPSLLAGSGSQQLALDIYAYAVDDRGSVRDFFTRTVALDLGQAGAALRQSGFKYWGDFDLPPGEYKARVVTRNSGTGAYAVRSQAIRVPGPGQTEAVLLPPFFPEPAGKWILAREERGPGQAEVSYPFVLRGQPFIPAARPVLGRRAETELCLMGYNLGPGTLRVDGRLFDPAGAPVEGVELLVDERPDTGDPAFDRMAARLRVGDVPAGDYRLEVTVADPASGAARSASIWVVVGG